MFFTVSNFILPNGQARNFIPSWDASRSWPEFRGLLQAFNNQQTKAKLRMFQQFNHRLYLSLQRPLQDYTISQQPGSLCFWTFIHWCAYMVHKGHSTGWVFPTHLDFSPRTSLSQRKKMFQLTLCLGNFVIKATNTLWHHRHWGLDHYIHIIIIWVLSQKFPDRSLEFSQYIICTQSSVLLHTGVVVGVSLTTCSGKSCH